MQQGIFLYALLFVLFANRTENHLKEYISAQSAYNTERCSVQKISQAGSPPRGEAG